MVFVDTILRSASLRDRTLNQLRGVSRPVFCQSVESQVPVALVNQGYSISRTRKVIRAFLAYIAALLSGIEPKLAGLTRVVIGIDYESFGAVLNDHGN